MASKIKNRLPLTLRVTQQELGIVMAVCTRLPGRAEQVAKQILVMACDQILRDQMAPKPATEDKPLEVRGKDANI